MIKIVDDNDYYLQYGGFCGTDFANDSQQEVFDKYANTKDP